MPAMAPQLATRLGLGDVAAWDVNAACSGFLYRLATASGALLAHCADRVLLVAADVYSTLLDPDDRSAGIVFGDGAGAVVLHRGRSGEPGSVLAFDLGSDGSGDELIEVRGGGARERSAPDDFGPGDRHFRMRGREVFQHAVTRMTQSSQAVLKHAGWSPDDVDRFCAHQANARIVTAVGERVPVPGPRRVTNIDRVGNTGAAPIPIALADAASNSSPPSPHDPFTVSTRPGRTYQPCPRSRVSSPPCSPRSSRSPPRASCRTPRSNEEHETAKRTTVGALVAVLHSKRSERDAL
ncbi:3-oxoacyl-[acyl-carrier-protein] synthase III C-terminal domain-containing protein [Streptomyces sp. NPDC060027]|uniref:3-oxoacyl-[acyl-carrier-protein] synthase III C-terminal domain-containing protein n=1 Tax=Streptomyces sp. NPDC060027 TaxID=3347040 RepID=UPI00369B4A8C